MSRVFVVLCALASGCVIGLVIEPVLSQESSSVEIPSAERPGDSIRFSDCGQHVPSLLLPSDSTVFSDSGRAVEIVERGCPVCGQLKSVNVHQHGISLVDCCRCGVVFAIRGSDFECQDNRDSDGK